MKRFKRLMSAFWGKILEKIIPIHAKRLVYLVTLYKYMTGHAEDDGTELKELNRALTLATTSSDAMKVPSLMSKFIWKGNGRESCYWTEEKLRKRFVERCPCWLNYGRDDDLLKDIHALQKFVVAKR